MDDYKPFSNIEDLNKSIFKSFAMSSYTIIFNNHWNCDGPIRTIEEQSYDKLICCYKAKKTYEMINIDT